MIDDQVTKPKFNFTEITKALLRTEKDMFVCPVMLWFRDIIPDRKVSAKVNFSIRVDTRTMHPIPHQPLRHLG